jgi:hypothetical protein
VPIIVLSVGLALGLATGINWLEVRRNDWNIDWNDYILRQKTFKISLWEISSSDYPSLLNNLKNHNF